MNKYRYLVNRDKILTIASLQCRGIFLVTTVRNKPSIPVSSRVTSIIRLECRRNKWSNHPPTLTIWRKQSSTAIHPYIVARTKSLATADLPLCALYQPTNPPRRHPLARLHARSESRVYISRPLAQSGERDGERDFQHIFIINFMLLLRMYLEIIFSKSFLLYNAILIMKQ